MRYFLVTVSLILIVSLYLLLSASSNAGWLATDYQWLLMVNGLLTFALLAIVGWQLSILRRKLQAKVFGAKLTLRLVILFSLMAILPGVLVYSVSVQFLARSIDSWFNVRVDNALERSLRLGQTTLDNLLNDLGNKAKLIASELADQPYTEIQRRLNRLQEQSGVLEASILDSHGKIVAQAGKVTSTSSIEYPPAEQLLKILKQQRRYQRLEALPQGGLLLRVIVPINIWQPGDEIRSLRLVQLVPKQLSDDAETVQAVYRDYQELSLSRIGLKRLYALTLTLTLVLALLSAISMGFYFSQKLSAPLGVLAKGTKAVAAGDFTQRHPVKSRDELGILTQSFNTMTRQLADARLAVEENQHQLEAANLYLENLLTNLSAGVLAFDAEYRLRSANPSAARILAVDLQSLYNIPLAIWHTHQPTLTAFAQVIASQFSQNTALHWQQQLEHLGEQGNLALLIRGSRLPVEADNGVVVVFDEITQLMQAQRDAAWGEVARRLAHEIKNPLTPIQLSAERLQMKLADKLSEQDNHILRRATQTIINQVAALKNMVDAFSQYARSPQLKLQPLQLNQLVQDVLGLYETSRAKISLNLAADLPFIQGDATLLRQVVHNLLQNAQDALLEQENPIVELITQIDQQRVQLTVSDNGTGFAEQLLKQAFEPYVTTKAKGTGLGLAIVKKIVEEHGGNIQIQNREPHGARVTLHFPVSLTKQG